MKYFVCVTLVLTLCIIRPDFSNALGVESCLDCSYDTRLPNESLDCVFGNITSEHCFKGIKVEKVCRTIITRKPDFLSIQRVCVGEDRANEKQLIICGVQTLSEDCICKQDGCNTESHHELFGYPKPLNYNKESQSASIKTPKTNEPYLKPEGNMSTTEYWRRNGNTNQSPFTAMIVLFTSVSIMYQ